jgi:hypothetical protein
MTKQHTQDTVTTARAALEAASTERDRFRASIEALAEQIAAATDVSAAMPLHTELETRRLFLVRAEANVVKAEAALAVAEQGADRARLDELAKSAAPDLWRAKLASLAAKALASERTWHDEVAALYAALTEQRKIATEAGSSLLPVGAADALLTLGRFEAHRPRVRIMVPQTRAELIPTVLASCDALHVASDLGFRSTVTDDALLAGALDGTLLPQYEAWANERKRRQTEGRAALEERERRAREDQEAWYRDPDNEALRAQAEASRAAALSPPAQT